MGEVVEEVIKSLRWLSEELRDEKRGMEAKICRVAADRLESLDEDVKTWMVTFDMLNDRENRHGYLDWWREKNGRSELCYPDGDEVYKDFFEMKAKVEQYESVVGKLAVRDGEVVGILCGKETEYVDKKVATTMKNMAVQNTVDDLVEKINERVASCTLEGKSDDFVDGYLEAVSWYNEKVADAVVAFWKER